MKLHWEVRGTAYKIPRDHQPVALHYNPTPGGTKHPDGSTSYSLVFPALILTDIVSDQQKVAEQLADELNLMAALKKPRPIAEYHEDMGDVMWWCWVEASDETGIKAHWLPEAPYVGALNDLGYTVEADVHLRKQGKQHKRQIRMMVGGWPGYHTHFTPLPPMPDAPTVTNGERGDG